MHQLHLTFAVDPVTEGKKGRGKKRVKLYNFAATYLHCHYVHGTEVDRGQSDVNFSLLVLQLLQHKPHRIPYYLANAQGAAKHQIHHLE